LFTYTTRIYKVRKNTLEIITPIVWICFTAYTAWYLTSAKYYAPLTLTEARLLWKIHKQNANCRSEEWHKIQHNGKIIGFECTYGYRHTQKKLVAS